MLTSLRRGVLAETSAIPRDTAFARGDRDDAGTARRWAWGLAALFLVAITLAPLLVVDVPAVLDYPNHLARFYILAHPRDPVLSQMYAPHWAVLPNVGMDLLGQALLRVAPPDVGGRIMLALSLLAPAAGTALYARAAFGRWTWWSLGAAVIAFNGIFILGFMNFLLGLGLALAGAAAWRALRRRGGDAVTALAGALIGLAVFFCHLLGFGFFALLVGAQEAHELFREQRAGRLSSRRLIAAAVRLAVALGPPLALYALTHRATQHGDALSWIWRAKLVEALIPFMTYDWRATLITAALVGALTLLVWRRARRASGVVLALALLAGLYLVAPFEAGGGTLVDTRLPLMAALLLFAGVEPRLSRRAGIAGAAVLALLALGRAAEVAVAWQGRARDLAELRAELAHLPPGAKVLPARTPFSNAYSQRNGRALPYVARLDGHLAGLAVIERRAFWPTLFADPGQQPVVVRPPYLGMSQPLGAAAVWRYLLDEPATRREVADFPYLADWRNRFDYVLAVGPEPAADETPRGLELIRAGEAASLYRIGKPAP